jgi:hypothetical protein
MAAMTSRMGIASMVMGSTREVGDWGKEARGRTERIKPRKRLPESPMNILAGGKLKKIYPNSDPVSAKLIMAE